MGASKGRGHKPWRIDLPVRLEEVRVNFEHPPIGTLQLDIRIIIGISELINAISVINLLVTVGDAVRAGRGRGGESRLSIGADLERRGTTTDML